MKTRFTLIGVALAAALNCAAVNAQVLGGGVQAGLPAFEDVDTDSDGRLSQIEVAMIEGVEFTSADQNQDGYVSREEYMSAQQ